MVARLDPKREREDGNRIGVTVARGVVVDEVLPGSPAATAGLARGDVIEEVDGEEVHGGEQLRAAVLALPRRAAVALTTTRAGKTRRVTARLD